MSMDLVHRPMARTLLIAVRDAAIVVALCAAAGIGTNAARRDGIPLIQKEEYQILVPCPELTGEVGLLEPDDARLKERGTLIIDARSVTQFDAWHLPDARSLPYDYLEPVAEKAVKELVASRASLIAVYGDGADPDSGHELAKELVAKGIRNVFQIKGGAPALGAERP
jgi:rhodanese-related sulfurtransferase